MKPTALLFFLFLILGVNAQNIRFEGAVTDSLGSPLEMANVMAVNAETKAMDAYNITNNKGLFLLNLKPNTVYNLKVSYIGFKTFDKSIITTNENTIYPVVLKDGSQLEAVDVVYEMPVTISGDSIIYNADSFTNGTERKLEDILKKLPGFEVTEDGEIKVEGKTAQKVMINGKDFFDGDTKLAIKNIPSDAVDKVQAIRNYSEVTNLKGLENNDDNIAINIKLKEGKENFWFGDVTAGGGTRDEKFDRYIINPKLFYYSKNYSINIIGNLNNIGELPLTARDYFKFTGGFRSIMRKGGSSFNVASNDLGLLGLRNDQALEINTKFGAANFSYSPNKALTFSGFGIFLNNNTDILNQTVSSREDVLPNGTIQTVAENKTDVTSQDNTLALFKLSSSYVPSTRVHLDYDVLFKVSDQNELQNTNSNLLGVLSTEKTQKPNSLNQNLNYYYTLNDKHIFSFESQYLYQDEDPFYNANLQFAPAFANLLPGYSSAENRNDITQNRFVKTNKVDAKLDYYWVVTPKSNLNFTLGNTYSYQNFNSHIFQVLDNQTQNDFNDPQNNNDVNYLFNDAFIGLHYKFIAGDFTFNPGVSAHAYSLKDVQLNSENKNNFTRILPDFFAKWDIKKSESLTYTFAFNNNFTDINRLAEGYVFNNYNSLTAGNRALQNSLSQVHSLRYFRYNMFNFENIFANLSYTKQTEAVKNRVLFDGITQISSAVNINEDFADESISGSFNYGRSFAQFFKASGGVSLSWNKFNNIRVQGITENIQTTESLNQNYNVKLSTLFQEVPNLTLGYNYSVSDNFSDTVYTDSPSVGLEYYFKDAWTIVSDYNFFHNYNKSKTIDTEYDFLSASVAYRKKSTPWEYTLKGTNLLNTKALNTNSFSQLGGTSVFSSYFVQPVTVMLSVRYNL